jgi:hypothetical protein
VPRETLDEVVTHFAPALTTVVARQIVGEAKRTDLEFFARLMKILVRRHPALKDSLNQALAKNVVDANEAQARTRLVQQLSATTSVVKIREFLQEAWFRNREMLNYSAVKS